MIRYRLPTAVVGQPLPERLRRIGPWEVSACSEGGVSAWLPIVPDPGAAGAWTPRGTTPEGWGYDILTGVPAERLLRRERHHLATLVRLQCGLAVPVQPVEVAPRVLMSSGAAGDFCDEYGQLAMRWAQASGSFTEAEMIRLCIAALATGMRVTAELCDYHRLLSTGDLEALFEGIYGPPKAAGDGVCAA